MKKKMILGFIIVLMVMIMYPAFGQSTNSDPRLVGTWSFADIKEESTIRETPKDTITQTLTGIIVFNANGTLYTQVEEKSIRNEFPEYNYESIDRDDFKYGTSNGKMIIMASDEFSGDAYDYIIYNNGKTMMLMPQAQQNVSSFVENSLLLQKISDELPEE
jgi:hypothetical protein